MDRGDVTILANLGTEPVTTQVPKQHRLLLASQGATTLQDGKLVVPVDGLAISSSEEQ
jgi:hypothetical protein